MTKYIKENGVMKYEGDPREEAVAWQGYDNYVNIDSRIIENGGV